MLSCERGKIFKNTYFEGQEHNNITSYKGSEKDILSKRNQKKKKKKIQNLARS